MSTYQTQKLIDDLQQQTESFINKAVTNWQMMPHKQFAYKEAVEKWSANQCLQHLNSYGHFYLPAIEKSIKDAAQKNQSISNTFTSGWLGNYFTNLMLPKENGTISKKMNSPKNHQPKNNADSFAVIAEFIEQQEKILQLLENARNYNLNTIKVPISLSKFIKIKLGDVFLFLIAHNQRHILQAEKALLQYHHKV